MRINARAIVRLYAFIGMAIVAILALPEHAWFIVFAIACFSISMLLIYALITRRRDSTAISKVQVCSRRDLAALFVFCAIFLGLLVAGFFSRAIAEIRTPVLVALIVASTTLVFEFLLIRRYCQSIGNKHNL